MFPFGPILKRFQLRIVTISPNWAKSSEITNILHLLHLIPYFLHENKCGEEFVRLIEGQCLHSNTVQSHHIMQ